MQRRVRLLLLAILILLIIGVPAGHAAQPAAPQSPTAPVGARPPLAGGQFKVWLQAPRSLAPRYQGTAAAAQALNAGAGTPLALAAGDFDQDGVPDLVVGYATPSGGALALYRGNLDAFAPQSKASFDAIGRGQFPDPFLPNAQVLAVAGTPDFLATGDFNGDGNLDLAVGSASAASLALYFGDGHGHFTQPLTLGLPGPATALAAQRLLHDTTAAELLVGTGGQKPALLVFTGSRLLMTFPMPAAVTSLAFGNLYRDAASDTAMVAGGQVMILRGADLRAAAAGNFHFQLENVGLGLTAVSVDVGSFLFDRDPRSQMAVMNSDGSLAIVTRSGLDARPWSQDELAALRLAALRGQSPPLAPVDPNEGWQVAEEFPSMVASTGPGRAALMMRTRISGQAGDDVVTLDPGSGQLHLVAHANAQSQASPAGSIAPSLQAEMGMDTAAAPVAALPLRVNVDGRPGVVMLEQGQVAPVVMMPLPDPTFTVNTTNDTVLAGACAAATPGQCSLREAILEANATAGVDTIMVPAGTYTLTITNTTPTTGENAAAKGDLDILDGVNIVGAGSATTIVQAGTTNANGIDKVLSINPNFNAAFDTSLSGLTVRFGRNQTSFATDGFGGGFDWEATGTGTLTVTDVIVTDNSTADGDGGGITITNTPGGTGKATFSNCVIQNNTVNESSTGGSGLGGAIFAGTHTSFTVTNCQILNNKAIQSTGQGGGIFIFGPSGAGGQTQLHSVTISGNQATQDGGGIHTGAGILIDQSSVISNNTAGAGAGLWSSVTAETTTVSKSTITGNTASGNGGGIRVDNSTPNNFVMSLSRIAGNTAAAGSALSNGTGTVTATNNWWGTNSPAGVIGAGSPAVVFDPFIALTHTASPATIRINQSTTLTGSLAQDNHGTPIAAGNLSVLVGLPITFDNAVDGSIPNAQPETLNSSAQATATFNAGGSAGGGKADATVDQQTVTANIVILAPLQATKSFSPATVAINTPSTLTINLTNPNVIAVDGSFTDSFPVGMVVAATPGVTNTCGGTVTATAGLGSFSFSNASLAVGSCTITVKVSSPSDGTFNNSVTIVSTAASTGAQSTSNASLTVVSPPSIAKAFGAATIPLNGTTSLSFTINNNNTATALSGIAFTDNLPAGLVVAATPNLNSTCGGTATAVGGSSSVSLSGGSLAAGASCTLSIDVQGTTAGVKNNSVQVTDTVAGTGNTSNASITVVGPPVIIKAFGAASIPLNGSTSLSFTIQNNNTTTALTGAAFSDTLPAGLVVATPNGLTGSCGGGTITATQGTDVISLSGASLAASSSCTFSVNVTGTAAGSQNNTTGNVTSTEGGTGGTASASINVVAPPSIAKVFNPSAIALNATTSLTFTITNPAANAVSLTGVAFTDTLPTGLTVANASATVCGGTLTTTAPTGISLSGATIAANSQCQFSVTVTGAAAGSYTNTTGNVTSTNGGTGNTASANLTVAVAPSITKVFGAASIPLNGTTSLTFNITNPNTALTLTGLAFTDNLPAGLVVAATPNVSNTCGGTVTAAAGASSVSLSAGTLASSASCSVSVSVQGTTAGVKNNSVQVSSTESGTGNTSNASITVIGPPVIIKAFGAASIPLNGSTSLSFTIQNNNTTTTQTGVAFSDTLPAGLVVATPNGLTGSCGGGTITATQGTNVISLSGASLAASSSCTFSVNVTGTAAGSQNNTTGNVTSTEGGTGGTASASLSVEGPPSIAKAFNPTAIAVNGTSTLTLAVTNPASNAAALTGVAVTDNLPAGLVVATPNGLANTCGGTATATAGSGSISLTGGTVATNSSCTVSVNVTASAVGTYVNTTGPVSSTGGGTGNTATATLSVAAPPTISKAFGAAAIPVTTSTTLSLTIHNPNATSLSGIAFTDNLPAGLVVATPNGLSGSCGGTITAAAGSSSVSLAGGTLAASANCTITVNVTATTTGSFNNTTGVITAAESGPGATSNTASLSASDFTIGAAPGSVTVTAGTAAMYTATITPSPAPFAQAVTLTVTGLPLNTTGSFTPNPIAGPINAASNSTLTVSTSPNASLIQPAGPFGTNSRQELAMAVSLGGFGFLGMVLVGLGGDRRRKRLLWILVGLVLLGVLAAGCGGHVTPGRHGTPPGTYTLTITGTATGTNGTLTHSTTVTLVVN